MKSDPYKPIAINLLLRGSIFAFVCYAAHLSGWNWGVFAFGGCWGVFVAAYPGCLKWS